MDNRRTQMLKEAARKFVEALAETYNSVPDPTVPVRQLNAELTQDFFNAVIENLHARSGGNPAVIREAVDQQQRQRDAVRALMQESVGAYVDFLEFMFSYYRGNVEKTEE